MVLAPFGGLESGKYQHRGKQYYSFHGRPPFVRNSPDSFSPMTVVDLSADSSTDPGIGKHWSGPFEKPPHPAQALLWLKLSDSRRRKPVRVIF
jgi:hypothetical protein